MSLISDTRSDFNWQADRKLAHDLLKQIHDFLTLYGADWDKLTGLGVYSGPGSFTGLRIGITVMNTLAESLNIPIVGLSGDDWRNDAVNRLKNSENDQVVLPNYGADAKITTPKK